MKNKYYFLLTAFTCAVLLLSACVLRNPPLNSVVTAHGNTDWHIDTAEEFLYGDDMSGTVLAPNHAPDTWSKRHIHTGLTNTADFYYDSSKTATGNDTNGTNGIDTTMLFFYAGHGNPTIWNTLGNNATQSNLLLANQDAGGLLRYYWMCSCEVFAHGDRNCSGSTLVYACPNTFDGSADSNNKRNVYERWGPALTADLRMACGVSTDAWCWHGEVNSIWDKFNNHHYYVSDAFVLGLRAYHDVVPLCITLGGSDWTNTPLWDLEFTNQPNTSGTSYYHIQYNMNFTSTPRYVLLLDVIKELPILKLAPMAMAAPLENVKFEKDGSWLTSTEKVEGRGPQVRINTLSGAEYVVGDVFADEKTLSEEQYLSIAQRHLQELGWVEETYAKPMGSSLQIQIAPVEGQQEKVQNFQKNVTILYKRQLLVGDQMVNVLGEGGVMVIQLNNDGSLFNAGKIWREVVSEGEWLPIKPYEQAFKEALGQIKDSQRYKLNDWNWGYKEMDGNVEQDEMRVYYQFNFIPVDSEAVLDYPPISIEILAQ